MRVFLQLLSRGVTLASQLVSTSMEGYKKASELLVPQSAIPDLAIDQGINPVKLKERYEVLRRIGRSAVGGKILPTEEDYIAIPFDT